MGASQSEWGEASRSEPRWPATLALLVAIGLYAILPSPVIHGLGPRWLVPGLEGALAIALLVANPRRAHPEAALMRFAAIVLIALVNIANLVTLSELIDKLLYGSTAGLGPSVGGRELVFASVPIWLTNIIVFALWFWELDRGGPALRLQVHHRKPDFLFPQMTAPQATGDDWYPTFLDYFYTAFTNATAFSPTDTMPLTPWAKVLMMVQSLTSLLTIALVVSRAVNILR